MSYQTVLEFSDVNGTLKPNPRNGNRFQDKKVRKACLESIKIGEYFISFFHDFSGSASSFFFPFFFLFFYIARISSVKIFAAVSFQKISVN